MNNTLSRRSFLGLAAAFSCGGCRTMFTGTSGDYDERLAILFSDAHISGTEPAYAYTQKKLRAFVAEVLRMTPLPRNIVFFGDLARRCGNREDYAVAASLLKPLVDAGIRLTLGVGNHDHHKNFFEAFPEREKASPVPGVDVATVHLPDCDILLLDSLNVNAEGGAGAGALSDDEQAWLAAELPKWPRPVLVGAHHEVTTLSAAGKPLCDVLAAAPNFRGYLGGHVHRWAPDWFCESGWGTAKRIWRRVTLPSLGYWGDIGWAEMRTSPSGAEVAAMLNDFYVARPIGYSEDGVKERPAAWGDVLAEKKVGSRCLIRLRPGNQASGG